MPCHVVRGIKCQVDHCSPASLSLEPVYQQGYLTASTAPEDSDSPSGWEGCQQSPWKARQEAREGETEMERGGKKNNRTKSEGITLQRHEWQCCFRATILVTKIYPIMSWRKRHPCGSSDDIYSGIGTFNDWHVSGSASGISRNLV